MQLLRNLEKYDDVTTPELMGVATRLVSAAVSLLPGRLTRSAAKETLKEIVGVAKTRREKKATRAVHQAMRAAAAHAAYEREEQYRLERANIERGDGPSPTALPARRRRAAIGYRGPPTVFERDLLGRARVR